MELLKEGSKGMSVTTLQTYLKNTGYNLIIDGVFGEITEEAVKDYQKKNKLVSDGIVGNKTWNYLIGSKPTTQTKRKINLIVLHCYGTKEGQNFTVKDVDKWHKQRGWKKIGYQYVIDLDGTIHKGREEYKIRAHATGYNAYSLGISYCGGCDKNGKAKDTRTKEQKESMLKLVHDLLKKYNLTLENVKCHNQLCKNGKQCPSFSIDTFKKEYHERFS